MPVLTVLGESGLKFFGKMSAANAHEIKNALAIINENAGLLGDLAVLAEKGAALNPDRLKRIADQIQQQVLRADEIAKSTNRFAHSLDKAHGPADLAQSLALIETMAMRFATKRHIGIEVVPSKKNITLPVQPFMLLQLLWLCLQCAMDATNAEKTIRITAKRSGKTTVVCYGPLSHLEASTVEDLKNMPETKVLLRPLKGSISTSADKDELVLTFLKQVSPDTEVT